MAKHIDFTREYNEELFTELSELFSKWQFEENYFVTVAMLIANQRLFLDLVIERKLHLSPQVNERKKLVKKYVNQLSDARETWLSMPSEDQVSLSHMIYQDMPGHEVKDLLDVHHLHAAFFPNKSMPGWRQRGLMEHTQWKIDTEFLDLLIGMATAWLESNAPATYSRQSPEQDAVNYIVELWRNASLQYPSLKISSSPNSRLTQVIEKFFGISPNPDRPLRDFRTMIKRAISELPDIDI